MLKNKVRNLVFNKRKLYTDNFINQNSSLIKNNLFSCFDFSKIKILHIFLPIIEKHEIDTFLIINEINVKYPHIKIIVPVVDFGNKILLHKYYNSSLSKNKYGILEPINSEIFTNLNLIDIILIPLLAFDIEGNRIGYGGGYYDKFLINCKGKKVGLSFEEQVDLIKDINEFDIKLDYCVTPKNVYCF